jgi:hypothetical protein
MLNARSAACVAVACAVALTVAGVVHGAAPNKQTDVVQTSRGELRLTPLYHGSVMLEFDGKVIHVDPWSQADYTGLPPADLIVITHTHADHLDRAAVEKLKKPGTLIVSTPAGVDTLNCAPACGEVESVSDSDRKTVMGSRSPESPCTTSCRDPRLARRSTTKGSAAATFSGSATPACISRATPNARPR